MSPYPEDSIDLFPTAAGEDAAPFQASTETQRRSEPNIDPDQGARCAEVIFEGRSQESAMTGTIVTTLIIAITVTLPTGLVFMAWWTRTPTERKARPATQAYPAGGSAQPSGA